MLLEKLVEYYDRSSEDRLPTAYERLPVKWLIDLDKNGNLRGFIPTTGSEGRKRDRGKIFSVPALVRTSGISAKLLADRTDYVLGVTAPDASPKQRQRVAQAHEAFVALVEECSRATGVQEVEAVRRFLAGLNLDALDLPEEMQPGDNVTFLVNDVRPIDIPAVQDFWARYRASSEQAVQCLVCGKLKPPVSRQPVKIKGIPGGQPAGMTLVSANENAFESYGLKASLVSPMCAECAEKHAHALNKLLADASTHLTIGGATYVFWTRNVESFSVVSILAEPDSAYVKSLLESIYRQREPLDVDTEEFYMVSLGSSGARVTVRDWLVTTLGQVKRNIGAYFNLQRIVGGRGEEGDPPIGLYALASSLVRESKDVDPRATSALVRLALAGEPLPPWILAQAVRRCCSEQGVIRSRAAIIKMVLCSRCQWEEVKKMERLNPNSSDNPAYTCGRLLAVLEHVQREALGRNVKSTIVDRYYGMASSAPATVFGRLLRGAQSHLAKMRKDKRSSYEFYQRQIEQVLECLGDRFPAVLNLEQQGYFALGYYHQRAALRPKQAGLPKGADDEKAENNLPEDKEE